MTSYKNCKCKCQHISELASADRTPIVPLRRRHIVRLPVLSAVPAGNTNIGAVIFIRHRFLGAAGLRITPGNSIQLRSITTRTRISIMMLAGMHV